MKGLYKGKRKDNGEWIEGYYTELPVGSLAATIFANDDEIVCEDTAPYIITIYSKQHSNYSNANPIEVVEMEIYEVIPETVRQCTGLKDKNGKPIFEDDILKGYQYPFYDETNDVFNYYAIVMWFETALGLLTVKAPKAKVRGVNAGNVDDMSDFDSDEWEIIGNTYDNPELYTTIPNYGGRKDE